MRLCKTSLSGSWFALLLLVGGCGGDDAATGGADGSMGGSSNVGGNGGASSMTGGAGGGSGGAISTGGGGAGGSSQGGAAGTALPDGGQPTDGAVIDVRSMSDATLGPMAIATDAGRPTGIALSTTDVYWAAEDKDSISTCPKTGCAGQPTLIVSTPAPRGIALRGNTLYWITAGTADASMAPTIKKCTLGACAANQIVDLSAGRGFGPKGSVGLAADDQRFYAVGGPVINTCPVAGCGDAGQGQLGSLFNGPRFGVAVDATTAYSGHAFGGITACPLSGCSSAEDETRFVDGPNTIAVALDNTNVYWSESPWPWNVATPGDDGAIRTCPKAGCVLASAKVVSAGSITPYAMAVDDTNLYYTDYRKGTVQRILKTDFAHTCVVNHLASCGNCGGEVKCDGTCTCAEAGTD